MMTSGDEEARPMTLEELKKLEEEKKKKEAADRANWRAWAYDD